MVKNVFAGGNVGTNCPGLYSGEGGKELSKDKPHHAVCTRKGGGGSAGLSAEALEFQYAGNGETNGHI